MDYKQYENARDAAWELLLACKIQTLPVDLNEICKRLGIRVFSYNDAQTLISSRGMTEFVHQTDGLSFYLRQHQPIILFDEKQPVERRRFTIAHEIGHIWLGHLWNDPAVWKNQIYEKQANQFAVRLLAPACVLWASNVHTPEEISKMCKISMSAARHRAQRMNTLVRRGKFLKSPLERKVYDQFQTFIHRHQ